MKNRSSMEIVCAILECIREGATRTRIIFQAAITIVQADKYLELLKEHGLVLETQRHSYRITESGMAYLHRLNEMCDLIA